MDDDSLHEAKGLLSTGREHDDDSVKPAKGSNFELGG